jgi:hypothetical protein
VRPRAEADWTKFRPGRPGGEAAKRCRSEPADRPPASLRAPCSAAAALSQTTRNPSDQIVPSKPPAFGSLNHCSQKTESLYGYVTLGHYSHRTIDATACRRSAGGSKRPAHPCGREAQTRHWSLLAGIGYVIGRHKLIVLAAKHSACGSTDRGARIVFHWSDKLPNRVEMAKKRTAAIAVFAPPGDDTALDEYFAKLRTPAVNRILEAVGKSVVNESQFGTDIFWACIATRRRLDLGDGAKAAERLHKVREIKNAVEKHASVISGDLYLGELNGKLSKLRIELQSLETELSSISDNWRSKADLTPELKGRRPSEPEWLTGVALPLVYERHFASPAGRSRNINGKPGGQPLDSLRRH